jgi:dTDP-4-amino-4,6-dideoxy-D-galactose acyltransferase
LVSNSELLLDLPWNSRWFGLRIARVAPQRLDAAELSAIEHARRERSLDCLFFLCSPAAPETMRAVSGAGWRFIDVRTTLARLVGRPAEPPSPEVRDAVAADLPALRAIAAVSHTDSRYYQDGGFPRSRCDAMFTEWIEQSVAGALADAVLVTGAPGAASGYVTLRRPAEAQGEWTIGLFAVTAAAQGKGLGRALLATALSRAHALGATTVSVVTQGCNARAQRAYENAGFRARTAAYWYHAWRATG